jgi:hypothetical protein
MSNKSGQYEFPFDVGKAVALRDEGMERAAAKAEREDDGWQENALAWLTRFETCGAFMAEDFREHAYKNGLPKPSSERAWGAVFMRAKRLGLIYEAGFSLTKTPGQHRCPGRLWRKT